MKEEKINITSEYDGLKLEGILISPESEIKAVIQLVHGMNEHKERYIDFMRFLAQNGYACFIHDHRGHGASLKNEEDIGYFYDAKAEYEKHNLKLPIHFIAGSDDPVIASKKDWEKAQTFLKNLGYTNMTSKLYENMSHEILNEVDNKTVYQDVLNWIDGVI